MKKIFAVAIVMGLSAAAFAGEAYDASTTTCAQLQAAEKTDGSLTVKTMFGENNYVASPADCDAFEVASPAYEFASDTHFCYVGYVCRPANHR